MASSTVTTEKRIALDLNEDEAKYLHAMLQNPLCNPEDEPESEAEHRQAIWCELNNSVKVR